MLTLKIAERDILRLIRLVICTRVNWEAELAMELAKLKPALSKYKIASGPRSEDGIAEGLGP